ncbi:methyltransferase domain-containing protein, partial [Dokdonella sp.]|uniref:methyltransferase domain-containing protein n=1 Tax=Dokdonella sp. TaxID=2291710 RepID=UPI002F3F022B
MITGPDSLFVLPEFEPLLRDELARVPAFALRQPAGAALLLQASAANRTLPVDLRHLRATRLHVEGGGLAGDARCASDALPYESDAFQFVVVQHAADALAAPDALVDELVRVLAPGGALLWFGLNPWSPWMLWFHWQARRGIAAPHARHPESLRRRLQQAQLTHDAGATLGPCWPAREARADATGLLAPLRGAWMLLASKQRAVLTPLRARPLRTVAPQPSLAMPARRVRA